MKNIKDNKGITNMTLITIVLVIIILMFNIKNYLIGILHG